MYMPDQRPPALTHGNPIDPPRIQNLNAPTVPVRFLKDTPISFFAHPIIARTFGA